MTKICAKCKQDKDIKEFPLHKKTNDGLCSWCRKCHSEARMLAIKKLPEGVQVARVKASRERNPFTARKVDWKRQGINITVEQFKTIYEEQEGKCAICKTAETDLDRKLSVDHCHETNRIRGLICKTCNLMLGSAKSNINILENAIHYLRKNEE